MLKGRDRDPLSIFICGTEQVRQQAEKKRKERTLGDKDN
jgi:hypothetical protein